MARQLGLLIALLFASSAGMLAQEGGREKSRGEGGRKQGGKMSPEFENVRKALDALSPEQRKRFQENFWRWSNLPLEQKRALRDREEMRRKRMKEEIDKAIDASGLTLDSGQREQFAKRYATERRKIEEQLRREMDEKRKPLVNEMLARLKAEFTSASTAQP